MMRLRPYVFVFAAGLTGVACTDTRTSAPTVPSFDVSRDVRPAACDFTQIRTHATAFFGAGKEPRKLITTMEELFRIGGASAATTDAGLDILQRVSRVVGTPAQSGTAVDGDLLTKSVLECTALTMPPGFSVVGALSPGGIYEIRGDDRQDPADTPALARSPSAAPWGLEPFGTATWGQSSGGVRFLLYGFERPPFGNESPAPGTVPTEIETIPEGLVFNPLLVVGACIDDPTGGRFRVLHETSIITLTVPRFCAGLSSTGRRASMFSSILGTVFDALAPRPLHASTTLLGGVGGRPKDFSPFAVVDAVVLVPTIATQPGDGKVNQPITPTVRVQVLSQAGTPIEGVLITITAIRHAGSGNISGNTALTDVNGIASFPTLTIDRPGAYHLQITASLSGYAPVTITSNTFELKR
jgi:hypothetical protein